MKKSTNSENVSKKEMKAAATAAAKEVKAAAKELRNERKNLRSAVKFLCTAERESAEIFRRAFGLETDSNKADRHRAEKKIERLHPRIKRVTKTDANGVEYTEIKYLTASGNEVKDHLSVVTKAAETWERLQAQRRAIARNMMLTRAKRIEAGMYYKTNENGVIIADENGNLTVNVEIWERIAAQARQAPAKYPTQIIEEASEEDK